MIGGGEEDEKEEEQGHMYLSLCKNMDACVCIFLF